MKKRRGIFAIFFAALALLASLVLFAACNGDEGSQTGPGPVDPNEVTVTFNLSGEGQDVTLTGIAGEAMTLPDMSDNQNYYFEGWHLKQDFSDDALGADAVFSKRNTTYFAKWYVKYKFEVSVEDLDGVYARDSRYDVEGESVKNSTDSVSVTAEDFELPEWHVLEYPSYTLQLDGRDNAAEVRFERFPLKVTYISGVSGIDTVVENGKYGMFAGDDVFGPQSDRRLLGWSESANGGLDILPEDRLYETGEKTLYAVWSKAYTDALGGSDVVFVAKGVKGVSETAILSKVGYGEIEGTYDEATGLLSFGGGERTTLLGKLLESTFFYFKDTYNKVFSSDIKGDKDTLQLKEGGGATYKDKQGVSIDGSYSIDEESGDFVFESENFTCNFKLYEPFWGIGDITFRMQDEYEGFYAEKQADGYGYTVLYFDGYGGAFEIWDPDHPYYNPYDEYEEIYFEGEYTFIEQSAGMPQVALDIIRVPSYAIDVAYTIRLDLSKTGAMGGVRISGVYVVKDDYEGVYRNWDNEEKAADELVLDGYEIATYKGNMGTYSAEIIQWYEFNGEYDDETEQPIYDIHSHKYIRFKGAGGKELLFALDVNDYAKYNTYSLISAEQNVFEFENSTSFLYDAQGGLMLELWHRQAIVWESHAGANRVTYYTKLDEGEVTQSDLGWKHFSGEAQFDFKITSLTKHTVRWRGAAKQLVFEEGKLYIDESGEGKYVDGGRTVTVEYTVDSGLVNLYRFVIGGKTRVFAERAGNIAEITSSSVFDEGRSGGNMIARLIFVDESRAIVGFRLSDGVSYAYLVDGEYVKDGDVCTFAHSAVEEGYEQSLSDYLNFEFKAADGEFVKNDGYVLSVTGDGYMFTADGYGNATMTKDGGETVEGAYEFLEGLTVFVYEGGERFLSVNRDGEQYVLKVVGEEAGYYFEISEGRVTSTSSYFFFDGLGKITYSQYVSDYATFVPSVGSYAPQNKTDEDGYTLYTLTFGEKEVMEGSYVAHVGFEKTTDGRTVGTFWLEDPVSSGTFVVMINGEPFGFITTQKGSAIWVIDDEKTVGALIRCDIKDGDIYTLLSDGTREMQENANGKSIFFSSGTYGQEGYIEFIFDITDETAKVDGVDYPVIDARVYDYGAFGRFDGGLKDERIYLDGHGNMTVFDAAGGVADEGTVKPKEKGSNIYSFLGANGGFDFVISLRLGSLSYEMNRFEYVVYDDESDNVFVGEDWTALVLDGFGGAELYDKYGMITKGTYSYVIDGVIKLEYDIVEVAYITLGKGTFEVNKDDFIRLAGVLYYYMGTESDIVIPDDVETIAKDAFYSSYITSVDFANVKRIEDGALSGTSLEEVVANEVTYVGEYAFSDIGTSLKRVSLPKAEHIGAYAFYGDTELDRITLGKASYIGAQAFTLCNINGTTLLDLSAIADLAEMEIQDAAFVAVDFEGEPLDAPVASLRVLVKDVETVNKLIEGGNGSELIVQNAVIYYGDEATSLEAASTKFGTVYYAANSGDVYIFDGRLSKIIDADAGKVQSVGLYDFEGEGKDRILKIYPLENGSYGLTPISADEGFLKIGEELLVEIGSDAYKQYEFADGDGKKFSLSLRVYYDVLKGIAFDAKVTYDSRAMTNVSVSGNAISFLDGNTVLAAHITGKGACNINTVGKVQQISTKGGKFRLNVALGANNELVTCTLFEEKSADNFKERKIVGAVTNADGSLTLSVEQTISMYTDVYTVVYDEVSGTLALNQNGNAHFSYGGDVPIDYSVTLVWDAETYQAVDCKEFTMDEQNYEVVEFVSNSATSATITIVMNGERVSFEMRYSVEFGYRIISLTQI